jgi:hypothetical protein
MFLVVRMLVSRHVVANDFTMRWLQEGEVYLVPYHTAIFVISRGDAVLI